MIRTSLLLCWLSIAAFILPAVAPAATQIYFVRHAETMGNLTHRHTHQNDRTLSPQGRRQVAALTRKLARLDFDHIITSPKYRALITILPYLKTHHLRAEIWPGLAECCWQKQRQSGGHRPGRGDAIRLDATMRPYFIFPDADAKYFLATRGYGDGMMQIFMTADRIRQRFAGTDQRILIVGHYHAGSRLIEILQGLEPTGRYRIGNTQLLHLRENRDGSFTLLNDTQ